MRFLRDLFSQYYQNLRQIELSIGNNRLSLIALVQFGLYLIIAFVLVRSLKFFLKRQVLAKLNIDPGNREAIASLIAYSFGALSLVVILQTTGFNLSSLAVIAGGLGVGIGFGLQELTKNFVSGLTLLLERNVKAGDFIEFDGLEGYVDEISTRSTVILTRDGLHVIVPNNQLVENRLINWTFENSAVRIHIPVTVAYGSDSVLVTEALLKAAYQESSALLEPAPQVIFIGFGDSALQFELWVWIKQADLKSLIRSSLNFSLEYHLRQYQLSIPFPQRDLWIRNPEAFQPANHSEKQPETLPQDSLPHTFAISALLAKVSYFSQLNELELRQLLEIGVLKALRSNEILFRENDPGDAFYLILSGSVEIYVAKLNKHLTTLNPGDSFGELALLLGIPRTATVKANDETTLFAIAKPAFEKLLQRYPAFSEIILHELAQHQEELTQRQQELRQLGLIDQTEDHSNPVIWVRQRLQRLFGLKETFESNRARN
ncbi:MAG: cyclic nucleotide-binding domain-containing protein [Cyanobacteria bacterium P01_H01_bin.15]